MQITTKKFLRYTLLPEIFPRIRYMFNSGFGYISFFIAQIYSAVRLLPSNHPYLNPENMGRFGLRHVVAEAAHNLRYRKENIDQIVVFGLTLTGLVLLLIQFFFLAGAVFVETAHATMPTNFAGFFVTADPEHDVAFVLLERVFGVPAVSGAPGAGFFDSCVSRGTVCFDIPAEASVYNGTFDLQYGAVDTPTIAAFPWPFHQALHAVFQFYSVGLLVIALLIFLYFVAAVVIETAQSGTPFGRRFNHVWAPIRMVVALGLLIPLATGLNSAQYITLYAAKWGSGFATNGWNLFLENLFGTDPGTIAPGSGAAESIAGPTVNLIATPEAPPITNLIEFALVYHTCRVAEEQVRKIVNIEGYLVRDSQSAPNRLPLAGTPYTQGNDDVNNPASALAFFKMRDILIRFGPPPNGANDEAGKRYEGGVRPICGEIVIPTPQVHEPGARRIQELYYGFIQRVFDNNMTYSTCYFWFFGCWWGVPDIGNQDNWLRYYGYNYSAHFAKPLVPTDPHTVAQLDNDYPLPTQADLEGFITHYTTEITNIISQGVAEQIANGDWAFALSRLGWGGAGIWYNKIALMNGAVMSAAYGIPYAKHYPEVMEDVQKRRIDEDNEAPPRDLFRPKLSDKNLAELATDGSLMVARAEWEAYHVWDSQYRAPHGNAFEDFVIDFFGLRGLFDIRENKASGVHPLAQLSAIGKSLLHGAANFFAASLVGGFAQVLPTLGAAAGMLSSVFSSLVLMAFAAGFILYYLLPFLPFIYFFFAVGGWVKGIFEAMVGVPLWALAHIRIDGNGLPGDAAMGGYYLILEIFLRPILIVFGLLASILIFAAQVNILDQIWEIVTSSVGGFDNIDATSGAANPNQVGGLNYKRDAIDSFFFTIMYVIIVYMLGMASFKLIDQIPNYILRWMGAQVKTFGEQSGDIAQNLVRNTSVGINMIGGQLQTGVGQGVGAMTSLFRRNQAPSG